jgi:hypothetical protein
MHDFGRKAPRFVAQTPAGGYRGAPRRAALGQAEIQDGRARAQTALSAFDLLLDRARNIGNLDARGALLEWVSSPEVPGTPAERYRVVAEDLAQGTPWADISQKRVGDLELMDTMFETKVKQAEQAFSPVGQPVSAGSIVNLSGAFTPTGIALGAVGILGLLVVPLVMGE